MTTDDEANTGGRLPPLNALKAFDAAARHLNFSRAARELNVTPGAVSQQIRLLEDHAGGPLFVRDGRAVLLTDLGRRLQPVLREGFDQFKKAADLIYGATRRHSLSVSVPPSFAARWLIPRISDFAEARPDIEVWISADMQLADVAGGRVDVAVRYGRGEYPSVRSQPLLEAGVIPVCSPGLVEGIARGIRPSDLVRHTLIHVVTDSEESRPDWTAWFTSKGLDPKGAGGGPRFDQTALAIEAAAHGRGIALAPRAFVASDLASGRLIAPFADGYVATDLAYHTLLRRAAPREEALAFVTWLRGQASATVTEVDEL